MSGVKKNFLYSSIITTASYVFPLITFPYVSRTLGASGIGANNYVDSVINYILLFTMLGINTTGIRSIASAKGDRDVLSRAFSSLIIINFLTTLFGILLLWVLVFCIPQFYEYRQYFLVGTCKIIATFMLAEWFYKGREDFKYITQRSLIIKLFYVVSVFVFIRSESDAILYYALTCFSVVVNALVNIIHTRKFVYFTLRDVEVLRYLKPMCVIGCYIIFTSMYTSFNVAYLGFVTNVEQVGYYTTATKFHTIVISIFTAFTGVMLPRMTSLLSQDNFLKFKTYILKSQTFLIAFSIPIIMFCSVFASDIIRLLAGKGFENAVLPMKIIMPLVFVIGYGQISVIQILNPLRKDSIVMRNAILGAIIGISLNILLVPQFEAVGSSIVWLVSEVSIIIFAQHYVTKFTGIIFPWKRIIVTCLYYLPLLIFYLSIQCFHSFNPIIEIFLMGIILMSYSLCVEFKLKNTILIDILNTIKKKWIKKFR